MSVKKYDFNEVLKEFNISCGCSYKLPASIIKATISRNENIFRVDYQSVDFHSAQYDSLEAFLYYRVSYDLNYKTFVGIILNKEKGNLKLQIVIWPPNKIRYAYLCNNYFAEAGSLSSSCMRHKSMQKALNFYVKNSVQIVVIIDKNNKIHGRALLWDNVESTKLKKPFTYLDRVYARSSNLLSSFHNLAEENKWKYYPTTSVNNMNKDYYKKDVITANICYLPYNDTFRYLFLEQNLLVSNPRQVPDSTSFVTLDRHTNGCYFPELDPDRVIEVLRGDYISRKDAIKVKRYNGYVHKNHIVDINGDYYSKYDKSLKETKLDGYTLKENCIHEVLTNSSMCKTKSVYSIKYDGHIHKSNVINFNGELYHKADKDITCFKDKWYHISQCFINYDRRERNKEMAEQPIFFYKNLPETWIPAWVPYKKVVKRDNLIPKKYAIIAYDLIYNPMLNNIEYQEVYCTNTGGLVKLVTGEFIIDSSNNRKHLKKFNNKYYMKQKLKLSDKLTTMLPNTEQTFKPPNKKQLMFSFIGKEK